MSENTPATSNDPALGSEGDTDQLPSEDTLVERGVADTLDEGYSPPERDRSDHWGETPWEEAHGEPVARRLDQEEPEVWESGGRPGAERQPDRASRLEQLDDAGRTTDVVAGDAGVAGGAATAEEAAMHVLTDVPDAELGVDEVALDLPVPDAPVESDSSIDPDDAADEHDGTTQA